MDKETLTSSTSGDIKWVKVEDLPDLPLYEWAKKENLHKFVTGKFK